MKSLWIVLALALGLGVAEGCGPQRAFCPDVPNGDCTLRGDDASMMQTGGTSGGAGLCPDGGTATFVGGQLVCQ